MPVHVDQYGQEYVENGTGDHEKIGSLLSSEFIRQYATEENTVKAGKVKRCEMTFSRTLITNHVPLKNFKNKCINLVGQKIIKLEPNFTSVMRVSSK